MSTKFPVETKTRRIRMALGLIVTSAVLQCVLVFGIYDLHLSAPAAYLLALICCLPIFTMVALAARVRTMSPDTFPRSYLIGIICFAAMLVASSSLITTLEVLFSPKSLSAAGLLAAFPILEGAVPAVVLLLPKRMMGGHSLGESLLPVRIKLATPALRLACRLAAFLLVYTSCDFAVRIFFDNHAAKGALAYAIALLPVLPISALIPIYNKYMAEEQDEFQRHLFNQSILWALLGILIVVCAVEQLEGNALISHRLLVLFRPDSFVLLFYFLQLEAGFVIKAIHTSRLKRNQ